MINKIKKKLRSEKGITLVTLMITVLLLVIIASIISINSASSVELSNLTKLKNDIEELDDRVAAYYIKEGKLPLYEETSANFNYTRSQLSSVLNDMREDDGNDYGTIDISKLNSLTLNYGKEYDQVNATDKYIINKETHVVYYLAGVGFEGVTYHTTGANPSMDI